MLEIMWQMRDSGSSAQCTPVRICCTRRQGIFAFIEPVDVQALTGEFAFQLPKPDVSPHRHPVAHVVSQQL